MPPRSLKRAFFYALLPLFFPTFPVSAQPVRNHYAVYLADAPVSARFATRAEMRTSAAAAYRLEVETRQQAVLSQLRARNFQVTGSVSTLLNAIFVTTTADRVAELQAIPGVTGVRIMPPVARHLNKAVQLSNAPTAWNVLGGQQNGGAGMKIAILDTGIDQTHPAFQDSSLAVPSGFPKCNVQSDCVNFTNNKVIVARSYVPQIVQSNIEDPTNPAATSMPDDYSARDRVGHGTAVASAAGANQNTGTVTFTGMAPKAYLGNYKIWGTEGVNDSPPSSVWIQALEDALNDGMDVASISSGAPALTGPLDTGTACGLPAGATNYCDPLAAGFEAAAKSGMVVIASAGNSNNGVPNGAAYGNYPVFNSISSPASAPSVVAVGATTNSHTFAPTVSVNSSSAPSSLKNINAQMTDAVFYPSFLGANSAPLVDVSQIGDAYGCSAFPAGSLNGAYALIERGPTANPCTFGAKATNTMNAGGIGIVFYMAPDSAAISPGPEGLGYYQGVSFFGPAVIVSNSDGVNLKNYIDANPGQAVTIDTAGLEQALATYNQVASYASFGPTPVGAIKPDLVAPGGFDSNILPDPDDYDFPAPSGMYLATQNYDATGDVYSTNRYAAADGTSFAAPLVAGAAALVKQNHPKFTAQQVKSTLLTSAAQDVSSDDLGDAVDVEYLGAGRLDAGAAINATVTAEPASISFGFQKAGAVSGSQAITVTNQGTGSVTLAAAVAPGKQASGTTVAVDKSSLTLAAGAAATLNVTLSGSSSAAGEYNGAVTLQGNGVSARLPYMFIVGPGAAYNAVPLFAPSEGTVGQDVGPIAIQVTDANGYPITGTPVTFSVSPRGSLTLGSADGTPACTPASTPSSTTCPTDNYGIAYAEVVLGTTANSNITLTATPSALPSSEAVQQTLVSRLQPTITSGGVVNDASFQAPIAPGSWVAIFGSNLTDGFQDFAITARLPLSLDGITVSFDVPSQNISVPGYVYFVSPGQVNVFVPWELEGQTSAQVKVTIDEISFGNVVQASLANYTPSFFLNSGSVADAVDNTTGQIITASNAAKRGQPIQLYANGLGPVQNQPASGDPASTTTLSATNTPCTVSIGGQSAPVSFCGLAPGFVGLYQINVTVPTGISAGNQPVTVSVGGATSPAQTVGSSPQTIVIPVQ